MYTILPCLDYRGSGSGHLSTSPNMSFKCQKDSYLRQFTTKVVSCQQAKHGDIEGFEVILEDTILFPEGGGQPDDRGKIADIEVLRVERRGGQAVHFVTQPLTVGQEVKLEVDWTRRHDHMQQHSGQHLITAITDSMFGYKTTSWNLAIGKDSKCFIELSTPKLTQDEIQAIEDRCNECIRQHRAMTPRWLDPSSEELEEVRSRGLPDDFVGQVRVVDIEGIDSNMCCGTHVSNLSDIQCIKLLHTESKKGITLLFYVAGNRVIHYLAKCTRTEKELTKLLSTGLDDHCDAVDRLLKTQRQSAKVIRTQLRELAQLIAFRHLHSQPLDPLAIVHKEEGDNEFMNIVASELSSYGITVFVTVGGDKGNGQFLLAGNEALVNEVGPRVAELLEGKGGGRKGRYQGKATKLQARVQVEALLRERSGQ